VIYTGSLVKTQPRHVPVPVDACTPGHRRAGLTRRGGWGIRGHMDVQVECVPGPGGESEPRRLRLGESSVEVLEVLDRWPAIGHRHFKLRAADGGIYIVRQDTTTGAWQVIFYRGPGPAGGRNPEGEA
jgi:hypothetical protein